MKIHELAARCLDDLTAIEDNLRWAHTDGYNPTNATPGCTTPPPLDHESDNRAETFSGDVTPNPDQVRAPRHDIGIGDHKSRAAYRKAIEHLRQAEGHLTVGCWFVKVDQPPQVRPTPTAPLADVPTCIERARTRIKLICDHQTVDPTGARMQLRKAAAQLDKAWHTLNHAFERGAIDPNTQAFATKDMCRICYIRPTAPREQKTGGRCKTCKTWLDRNKYERPTKLDGVNEARAAQRRRRGRGEGWGDESGSCTTPDR